MTDRGKHLLSWIGFSGLLALLGCAAAAGVARYQLSNKVDQSVFREHVVSDSAERAADRRMLLRIDRRVSAIYCGQVPEPNRAGCQ